LIQKLKEKNLKEKLEIRDSSLSAQDSPVCLLCFAASSCLVQRRSTRKPKGVIAVPAKRVIAAIPAKPHHSRSARDYTTILTKPRSVLSARLREF